MICMAILLALPCKPVVGSMKYFASYTQWIASAFAVPALAAATTTA